MLTKNDPIEIKTWKEFEDAGMMSILNYLSDILNHHSDFSDDEEETYYTYIVNPDNPENLICKIKSQHVPEMNIKDVTDLISIDHDGKRYFGGISLNDINRLLHLFGWAITCGYADNNPALLRLKPQSVLPARTSFRGMRNDNHPIDYIGITRYLRDTIVDLLAEAEA